jgi:signal transduction histidine kinase
VIEVTDNGSGIREDIHDKIFIPNFTTKSSGTGLGLAICKQIMESINGAIYFKSKKGGPTTFYLKFQKSDWT